MKKYYHYIVENKFTGERLEIIKRTTNLTDSGKYKVIACCGYHEKGAKENETL